MWCLTALFMVHLQDPAASCSFLQTNKNTPTFCYFDSCLAALKLCSFQQNKSIDQRENSIKRIVENYLKCFSGLKVEFDTLWYDIWADSGLICFDQHLRVCKDYWTSEIVLIRKRWREKTKPEYWKISTTTHTLQWHLLCFGTKSLQVFLLSWFLAEECLSCFEVTRNCRVLKAHVFLTKLVS